MSRHIDTSGTLKFWRRSGTIADALSIFLLAIAVRDGLAQPWSLAKPAPQLTKESVRTERPASPRASTVNGVDISNALASAFLSSGLQANGNVSLTTVALNFGMATTGGNPAVSSDDDLPMIYNYDPIHGIREPWTSSDVIRIDGNDIQLGNPSPAVGVINRPVNISATVIEGSQVFSASGIRVTKRVEFSSVITGVPDTAQITWTIENPSSNIHEVGVRCMLDVILGDNDATPILFAGEGVVNEFEHDFPSAVNPSIPEFWYAFQYPASDPRFPGVVTQGTIKGYSATPPDRIGVAYWSTVTRTAWDYAFNPSMNYVRGPSGSNGDSAILMWWNPVTVFSGASVSFSTYVGLARPSSCASFLNVTVNSISSVGVDCVNGYNPSSFTVQANISAPTGAGVNNVEASIVTTAGLTVTSGSTSQNVGNIAAGGATSANWQVDVAGTAGGTQTITITVTGDGIQDCVVTRDIIVPPFETCTPTPGPSSTPTNTATSTPTPTSTPPPPTNTPTLTPTPTNTPDINPPTIMLAGWGNTNIDTCNGGLLEILAYVDTNGLDDQQRLTLSFDDNDPLAGVDLSEDYDFSRNGFYGLSVPIGPGVAPGRYTAYMFAADRTGNWSRDPWPYIPSNQNPFGGPMKPEVVPFESLIRQFVDGPRLARNSFGRSLRPANAPYVYLAGYWLTKMTNGVGDLQIYAVVIDPDGANDIKAVNVFVPGNSTPVLSLLDDGTQHSFATGQGVFAFQLPGISGIPSRFLLEIQATDAAGNKSDVWPYLNIGDCTPTPTPTPTSTPTPTPTPVPPACCNVSPRVGPRGEYFTVDASCTTPPFGETALNYRFNWNDGDDGQGGTDNWSTWQPDATRSHLYLEASRPEGYEVKTEVQLSSGGIMAGSCYVKVTP